MSRIEEAMEKARALATASGTPEQPQQSPASANAAVAEQLSPAAAEGAEQPHPVNRKLVLANNFNRPVAEEYRKLKSIIMQLTAKAPEKNLLLVTSSIGGEGKSLTAINLAISLAQ